MNIRDKMYVDKACQETLAKYGQPQVAEAIRQLIKNDNPNCFIGYDNKENMSEIDKEELCGHMLASIIEGRALKESRHYALLLGTKKTRIENMDYDEIELSLKDSYLNGNAHYLQELTKKGIEQSTIYADKLINTFLHFRYQTHNLSPQELNDYEQSTYEGQQIASDFSDINAYQTSSVRR